LLAEHAQAGDPTHKRLVAETLAAAVFQQASPGAMATTLKAAPGLGRSRATGSATHLLR
jgi:hypothetical protein